MITGGNAAEVRMACGGAGTSLRGTKYGDYPRPSGGGDRYGDPDGGSYPNPTLAGACEPSRTIPLEKGIRSNKGLQATTHKFALCHRFRSLQSYIVWPVGRRLNPNVR